LLRVEVSGRLIDKVDIARLSESQNDSNALQLTTGQVLDFLVEQNVDLERQEDLSLEQRCLPTSLELGVEKHLDRAFELGCDGLGLVGNVQLGHGVLITIWG